VADLAVETIQLPNGAQAYVVRVPPGIAAGRIVGTLGLPRPRALLVLNGGTAELEEQLKQQLRRQIADGLARLAAEEQITLVTGATDAGVFALLGHGLSAWGRSAPCIGVAVDALSQRPGHPQGEAPLEPHHSHFVLVAGQKWGDETETMYALVAELAQHCASVAVFAGGGEIVKQEMEANIDQGRPMILLAGSGRTTDAVLAARAGQQPDDRRLALIAQAGNIIPFDIQQEPAALRDLLRDILIGDSAHRA
jgi:hypothetical protein